MSANTDGVRRQCHAMLAVPLQGAVAAGETHAHLVLGLLDHLIDLATDEQLETARTQELLGAERFRLYLLEARAAARGAQDI